MPCECCHGACCFCTREFYYYSYLTDTSGSTAYQTRSLGGILYPDYMWDCQDEYTVDGQTVHVPGNSPAPPGGTFVTKFCSAGSAPCRWADWLWDNAEDAGASFPYSSWYRNPQEYTACLQTTRAECEQCRETVDDLEKLQDLCGTFRPGGQCGGGGFAEPWPQGQYTCGCCLRLVADPAVVAMYAADWGSDWEPRWNAVKALLEAAGWTVTITATPYTQNDEQFVSVSMTITSTCCFDCEAMAAAAMESQANNGAITNQPAGLWVDVRGQEYLSYNPDQPPGGGTIPFGSFHFEGCCDQFAALTNGFGSPTSVNGVGDGGSTWVPSPDFFCNPLP